MKQQQFSRKLTLTAQTWATNTWTFTTSSPHYLSVGDTFTIYELTTQQLLTITCAAGTTGSTITYTSTNNLLQFPPEIILTQFPTGFTGYSDVLVVNGNLNTYQATTTTTSGNGSHSVTFQVSNDKIAWLNISTSSPTAAASPVTDGFVINAPWAFARINVTSVTGTGGKMVATINGERL